ncbi:uncharacterized protein PV09_01245 [Verruconis gallopava]|uniref:Heterokaryon incompatibility domain-containing protein n=1 Tax=Verruconis gallopava TaxID=253628 RepID=A0A0D2ANM9_9PEZI|nr:uncharacterized protein PV09_01245 [Verruconis gallopava]KIW08328.1 hypothetical protein PV09_01245 [Verruconis gallopava]
MASAFAKASQADQPEMYRHRRLDPEKSEIRLVTILPGFFDDPLRLKISHTSFNPLGLSKSDDGPPPQHMQFPKMFKHDMLTLAHDWSVNKTIDDRWLFTHCKELRDGNFWTSWDLPVPERLNEFKKATKQPAPEAPFFEALSYAWGRSHHLVAVRISSSEDEDARSDAILYLRPSLVEALHFLRYEDRPRTFWIDAICINQNDYLEKGTQVPEMWKIYKHAWRTIVWLGTDGENSGLAIRCLRDIAAQAVYLKDGSRYPSPDAKNLQLFQEPCKQFGETEWFAIEKLLSRNYFERLWIVSELAMSMWRAELICGRDSIPLLQLWVAVRSILSLGHPPSTKLISLLQSVDALSYSPNAPFTETVQAYRNQKCSDGRDKIYGLLSLASTSFSNCVTVDYRKSVEQTYRELFITMIRYYERLDLMQACRLDRRTSDLPSWVPDFRKSFNGLPTIQFSSGFSEPELETISEKVICVSGIQCCTVKEVCAQYLKSREILRTLREWLHCVRRDGKYPTDESLTQVFFNTVWLGNTCERYPGTNRTSAVQPVDATFEWLNRKLGACSFEDEKGHEDEAMLSQLSTLLHEHDFFTTKSGYFGIGPGITQPDDIVCAFLGSDSLTLLRPQGSNSYQVVGSCFVHGFHDASAFLGPLPSNWRVIIRDDEYGGAVVRFRNLDQAGLEVDYAESDADTVHDPRLGELSPCWEWVESERTKDEPRIYEEFYDSELDRYVHSDPRMSAEALRERGVPLRRFFLT